MNHAGFGRRLEISVLIIIVRQRISVTMTDGVSVRACVCVRLCVTVCVLVCVHVLVC